MASTTAQAEALAHSAAVYVRDDLAAVAVCGEDRLRWLNGQITCDARNAVGNRGVYGLAVTVRGKIMADLWVVDRGEHLLVLLPRTALDTVLASFERQIIMDDVELRREPTLAVISVQGPRSKEVIEPEAEQAHHCDELAHDGYFVLSPGTERSTVFERLRLRAETLGGCAIDAEGYELARLRAGRGRFGADFGEHEYPQEAGLGALAVSFEKGCYLGQEVVCTLENRGRLTRRLVRLELSQHAEAKAGAELRDEQGHAMGSLTSSAHDPESDRTLALGYVKRAHAVAGQRLQTAGGPAQVVAIVGGD
ncbi:MAG: YgfZ/GcvT domain-containing protein [Polyangiales bacterium]